MNNYETCVMFLSFIGFFLCGIAICGSETFRNFMHRHIKLVEEAEAKNGKAKEEE